ncbi:serine/threonine protein kinase [Streptomyces sp. NBC_00201]|uniref:serine/threonine protein kinase n=1 Tax=unclassified Streptomyces TaxID=2593676 RepID=UPI00224CDF47|nr:MULTISPECIES: serine/threonine-protein kinase [unclassified Streptomyces]MCX5252384.1 serine/threonine protein kinase [Streptomyces sp. NBC_00201]MCX5290747.1 serine/threonine protein kinase [Streptomyces sp. NBC_00183]
MTMVKAHVFTHELVAGRYRLVDVVQRETNRVCWYGKDVSVGRAHLLTQIALPDDPDGEAAPRATARIIRMSETMGLMCPGAVATVVDTAEQAGDLWIVTDWIDGTSLGELIAQQGTFNYVRAARIGLELLDVLEAAHREGITHGELSPGQIFVQDRGSVVVTGFGLAGATLAPRLTAPSYASPEQARDERIGPAADLWALGAILYTMVEGRPPFRDRDRPEATLKGVDRLPLRTPVHAGPLTQTVQGLLRKNSRERLTRQVVRESLTRVLTEDPDTTNASVPRPRLRGVYAAALHVGPGWSRRTMAFGTALAVVTVAGAALAVTGRLPGTGTSSTGAAPQPPVSATASATAPDSRPDGRQSKAPAPPPATAATATATATASPTSSPPPSSSPPTTALPAGFHRYTSPEGFSVALPEDWTRVQTSRVRDLSYRVTFGAEDDPRTLAVTYSTVAGPDPVAVWRDDVEPELEKDDGFQRIGEIKATTYQGHKAADMEWLSNVDGTQVRTFGRGFLLGGGRSFSLRWTTPAADWNDSANRQALDTFLRTFRSSSG